MERRKMLVVNDIAFERQVLCELFGTEFDILQACDGNEALSVLGAHAQAISVVLLDIVMPQKDGLDVLREMRARAELAAIPVIVTSSAGDDVFRMKALELGAVDYIATPFNPMLARLRVKSTLATREYDRLQLQNEILSLRAKDDANYRAVLEDSATAVLEFDGSGRVTRYDSVIKAELAGNYDRRELADIFLQDGVADPEAVEALRGLFKRVIAGNASRRDELDMLLRRADGARSWFRLRLFKKADGQTGEPLLVMSVSDIDKQKREEEATRAQLIRALGAAENASKAKGEFMSRMSHEIRTPLNAITGFVSLAKDCLSEPERVAEYLTKTEFATRHLLAIVNDVLDMSAIESGKMKLSYESCNLKEVVTSVTSIIRPLAQQKEIHFDVLLDGISEEIVMGDPMRLSQILLNLLSNAVKFTPQNGDVSLTIREKPVAANRVVAEFVVRDNGVGMTPEFLNRLGQPFEQQDATVAARYGGSGLGLSITKKLIGLMNGALSVTSAEGKGSTFTVTVSMDVSRTEYPRQKPYAFADVNVLVIDAARTAAEHVRACFRELGCRCDCTTSGREALALIGRAHYDMVLMDWKLPDVDGQSVIDALKRESASQPNIFIMAYDYGDVRQKTDDHLRFLHKPVFPSAVLDLMLWEYGKYDVKEDAEQAHDFTGRRLLLAEDNPMNMEIATAVLSKMGFSVVPVTNGREAVEAFETSDGGEYDAILMDVQMPVMDGYEATRRIRAGSHPDAKTVPILAMTASVFTQDVADALKSGMNAHIAKPIEINDMRRTLLQYVADGASGVHGGNER